MHIGLVVPRGIALFLGGFTLVNLLGEWRFRGFDANYWWIDLRPLPGFVSRNLLGLAGLLLVAWAWRPALAGWRRRVLMATTLLLLLASLTNAIQFFVLLARGVIHTSFPVPFSLFVAITLGVVLKRLAGRQQRTTSPATRGEKLLIGATVITCMIGFPLLQMLCFGKTDYRRPADVIVVFGARVYADGRLSNALADRVRTGCQLYREGLAPVVLFSGGPGDGLIHEAQAMRQMAANLGVPDAAMVLDQAGVNTEATVLSTRAICEELGVRRVLAVSHFYHLPRIKMTCQRQELEVYTVPAREQRTLMRLPVFLLREVAALWLYYVRGE
jgi:uncharacterized SAM-binding protein YcdF (DUF218 family)